MLVEFNPAEPEQAIDSPVHPAGEAKQRVNVHALHAASGMDDDGAAGVAGSADQERILHRGQNIEKGPGDHGLASLDSGACREIFVFGAEKEIASLETALLTFI